VDDTDAALLTIWADVGLGDEPDEPQQLLVDSESSTAWLHTLVATLPDMSGGTAAFALTHRGVTIEPTAMAQPALLQTLAQSIYPVRVVTDLVNFVRLRKDALPEAWKTDVRDRVKSRSLTALQVNLTSENRAVHTYMDCSVVTLGHLLAAVRSLQGPRGGLPTLTVRGEDTPLLAGDSDADLKATLASIRPSVFKHGRRQVAAVHLDVAPPPASSGGSIIVSVPGAHPFCVDSTPDMPVDDLCQAIHDRTGVGEFKLRFRSRTVGQYPPSDSAGSGEDTAAATVGYLNIAGSAHAVRVMIQGKAGQLPGVATESDWTDTIHPLRAPRTTCSAAFAPGYDATAQAAWLSTLLGRARPTHTLATAAAMPTLPRRGTIIQTDIRVQLAPTLPRGSAHGSTLFRAGVTLESVVESVADRTGVPVAAICLRCPPQVNTPDGGEPSPTHLLASMYGLQGGRHGRRGCPTPAGTPQRSRGSRRGPLPGAFDSGKKLHVVQGATWNIRSVGSATGKGSKAPSVLQALDRNNLGFMVVTETNLPSIGDLNIPLSRRTKVHMDHVTCPPGCGHAGGVMIVSDSSQVEVSRIAPDSVKDLPPCPQQAEGLVGWWWVTPHGGSRRWAVAGVYMPGDGAIPRSDFKLLLGYILQCAKALQNSPVLIMGDLNVHFGRSTGPGGSKRLGAHDKANPRGKLAWKGLKRDGLSVLNGAPTLLRPSPAGPTYICRREGCPPVTTELDYVMGNGIAQRAVAAVTVADVMDVDTALTDHSIVTVDLMATRKGANLRRKRRLLADAQALHKPGQPGVRHPIWDEYGQAAMAEICSNWLPCTTKGGIDINIRTIHNSLRRMWDRLMVPFMASAPAPFVMPDDSDFRNQCRLFEHQRRALRRLKTSLQAAGFWSPNQRAAPPPALAQATRILRLAQIDKRTAQRALDRAVRVAVKTALHSTLATANLEYRNQFEGWRMLMALAGRSMRPAAAVTEDFPKLYLNGKDGNTCTSAAAAAELFACHLEETGRARTTSDVGYIPADLRSHDAALHRCRQMESQRRDHGIEPPPPPFAEASRRWLSRITEAEVEAALKSVKRHKGALGHVSVDMLHALRFLVKPTPASPSASPTAGSCAAPSAAPSLPTASEGGSTADCLSDVGAPVTAPPSPAASFISVGAYDSDASEVDCDDPDDMGEDGDVGCPGAEARDTQIIGLVAQLVNAMLKLNHWPAVFRDSTTTFLFKGGSHRDRGDVTDYRPLTIGPALARWVEGIISARVNDYMESTHQLGELQAGFRDGRRVADNVHLLSTTVRAGLNSRYSDKYTHVSHAAARRLMNNAGRVDGGVAVLMDVAGAFDSCSHSVLFARMHLLGMRGDLWLLVVEIYASSIRCVVVGRHTSRAFRIERGVAQGSKMSPGLWLIAISGVFVMVLAGLLDPEGRFGHVDLGCQTPEYQYNPATGAFAASIGPFLIQLFADDILVHVDNDAQAQDAVAVCSLATRRYGAALKPSKCTVLRFIRSSAAPPDFFLSKYTTNEATGSIDVITDGDKLAVCAVLVKDKYLGLNLTNDMSFGAIMRRMCDTAELHLKEVGTLTQYSGMYDPWISRLLIPRALGSLSFCAGAACEGVAPDSVEAAIGAACVRALGTGPSTSHLAARGELGQRSATSMWYAQRMALLCQSAVARPQHPTARAWDITMSVHAAAPHLSNNWAFHTRRMLRDMGIPAMFHHTPCVLARVMEGEPLADVLAHVALLDQFDATTACTLNMTPAPVPTDARRVATTHDCSCESPTWGRTQLRPNAHGRRLALQSQVRAIGTSIAIWHEHRRWKSDMEAGALHSGAFQLALDMHPNFGFAPYLKVGSAAEIRLRARTRMRTLPLADAVLAWASVPADERFCLLCQAHDGVDVVEDAAHFIFTCPSLQATRQDLIPALRRSCAHPAVTAVLAEAPAPALPWMALVLGGDLSGREGLLNWNDKPKAATPQRHPCRDRVACLRTSGRFLTRLQAARWSQITSVASLTPPPPQLQAWLLHPTVAAVVTERQRLRRPR